MTEWESDKSAIQELFERTSQREKVFEGARMTRREHRLRIVSLGLAEKVDIFQSESEFIQTKQAKQIKPYKDITFSLHSSLESVPLLDAVVQLRAHDHESL